MYEQEKGNMTDHTDIIEKYLRGQMSQQEETYFKGQLKSNKLMHLQAIIISQLIKYKDCKP